MIRVLFLLFFSTLLFASSEDIDIIEPYHNYCTVIEDHPVCIARKIIKRKVKDAKDYQIIYINDKKVATGYPYLKNKTKKLKKYIQNHTFDVSSNMIYFFVKNKLYKFDFKTKKFSFVLLPSRILQVKNISNSSVALQYQDKNRIGLAVLDMKDIILKDVASKYSVYLRTNRTIDIINYDKEANFLKEANLFKEANFFDKYRINKDISTIIYPSDIQIIKHQYIRYKDLISDKPNMIETILVNKYLQPLSYKLNKFEGYDSYFHLYNEKFSKINDKFVHGNKSIYILSVSVVFLFIVLLWTRNIVGGYNLPTIFSFFILFYLVSVYIGSTSLNIFYFKYEYNLGFYERLDTLLNVWIFSILGLLLILLGAQIANKVFTFQSKNEFHKFCNEKIILLEDNYLLYILSILFAISVIVYIVYISKIEYVPIFGVFEGMVPEQLAHLRSISGNDFEGKVYRYVLFYKTLPHLYLLISFFYRKVNKRWLSLFMSLLFFNIFISIMDMAKAPLVLLFILLMIAYFFEKGKINFKILFISGIIVLGSLLVMYVLFMGISSEGLLSTFLGIFHRTFIGSISPFFWWQLYVEKNGYLNGLSLPNPHHIFDFEYVQISKVVMKFVHPELKEIGVVGSMPTVFWADIWINFGFYIMLLGMFLFGFFLRTIDILFIRILNKQKIVIILSLYIYYILYSRTYNVSTVLGVFFNTNIVIPTLITIIIYIFYKWRGNENSINSIK